MSQANVESLKQFLTATKAGDLEVVYAHLTDDVVVHEPPELPYGGDHHGKDGVARILDAIQGLREIVGRDLQFLDGGGQRVIAVLESDWIGRASGMRVSVKIVEIYTFRDRKIADIDIYFKDPAAVVAAVSGAGAAS